MDGQKWLLSFGEAGLEVRRPSQKTPQVVSFGELVNSAQKQPFLFLGTQSPGLHSGPAERPCAKCGLMLSAIEEFEIGPVRPLCEGCYKKCAKI